MPAERISWGRGLLTELMAYVNSAQSLESRVKGDAQQFDGPIGLVPVIPETLGGGPFITNHKSFSGADAEELAFRYRALFYHYLNSEQGQRTIQYFADRYGIQNPVRFIGYAENKLEDRLIGAMAQPELGAVIFTNDFWKMVDMYSQAYNIPQEYVAEYMISHELKHVLNKEYDEKNVELDLSTLYRQIADEARQDKDPEKERVYRALEALADERHDQVEQNYRRGNISLDDAVRESNMILQEHRVNAVYHAGMFNNYEQEDAENPYHTALIYGMLYSNPEEAAGDKGTEMPQAVLSNGRNLTGQPIPEYGLSVQPYLN